MTGMVIQVVRSDGVLALYNGLSASLCRQVGTATPLLGKLENAGPKALYFLLKLKTS